MESESDSGMPWTGKMVGTAINCGGAWRGHNT
jgi:hypothetical protein